MGRINNWLFGLRETKYPRLLDDRPAPGLTADGLAPLSRVIHGEPLVPGIVALRRAREEALGTPASGRWHVKWKSVIEGVVWDHGTAMYANELDRRCAALAAEGAFQFSIRPWRDLMCVSEKMFNNDPAWRGFAPNKGVQHV